MNPTHFGTELRAQRKARGLKQQDLSDLCGGTPCHTYISKLERGECLPGDHEMVDTLALALSATVAERNRLRDAYARDIFHKFRLCIVNGLCIAAAIRPQEGMQPCYKG